MKRILILIFSSFLSCVLAGAADSLSVAPAQASYPKGGKVEFFMGVDLNYRDITHGSHYEFLVNLTPGIKYRPWRHTQIVAQALIPVFNQYGDYYRLPRLNVLTISQELLLFKHLALKPTIGLFTRERWGIDVKAMYPLRPWVAFELQAGCTGYLSMANGWKLSPLSKFLVLGGVDFYLPRWNTQFRLVGGRFLYEDWGACIEGSRHFKHATVGAFVQYSNRQKTTFLNSLNMGFNITFALPPYNRRNRVATVRPASAFQLSYNMKADAQSCKTYLTDPEENPRHGWFSPDILPWGANLIYDYTEQ